MTGLPCAGKKLFNSKALAKAFAVTRAHKYGTKRQRPYHCPHCGYFHLTSRNAHELAAAQRGSL